MVRCLHSLRYRFIASILIIEILILGALTWNYMSVVRAELETGLRESGEIFAATLAGSTAPFLLRVDYAGLAEHTDAILRHPDLEYFVVVDLDGRVVFGEAADAVLARWPHGSVSAVPDGGILNYARDVVLAGQRLGRIYLGFSLAGVEARSQAVRDRALTLALVVVLATAFVAYMVGTGLTRRLRALADAAQRVVGGDLDFTTNVGGRDEVGVTAEAFDKMVAARKKAEDVLRASETDLAFAQRLSGTGSWTSDHQTGRMRFSLEARRIFGLDGDGPDESYILAKRWFEMVHPDDRGQVVGAIREARRGKGYRIEYRICRRDGVVTPILAMGETECSADGSPVRFYGAFQDMTDVRQAERALRRSEQYYRSLIENVRDVVGVLSPDATVTYVSPASRRVLGLEPEELVGTNAFDRIHPEDLTVVQNAFQTTLADPEQTVSMSYRVRHNDGSWRHAEAIGAGLLDEGILSGAVLVFRDVTLRVQADEQLRQSQKMEAVGQLTGGIAHDFNNLLTIIIGNLELLEGLGAGNPPALARIQAGIEAAERGAALTQQLLAFSRRQPLQAEMLDLNKLVTGMSDLLRRTLGATIEIEVVTAGGLWRTKADRTQVENALLNLAVNARDAMPDGGKLTIETANVRLDDDYAALKGEVTAGQYVLLAVTDTGVGMPAEIAQHAFEPFFTTKEVGKGTGLGLSMVYGFLKQSGGHAQIYSEIGVGTTIKLYLPKSSETGDEKPIIRAIGEQRAAPGEAVLVVEDDVQVSRVAVDILKSRGYRVLLAPDAPKALDILATDERIDLLFTDVILPGEINGVELARKVAASRPGLRVLFTSGYTENAIVHHGRLDEGVCLLSKPYRAEELASKVRQVIDGVD